MVKMIHITAQLAQIWVQLTQTGQIRIVVGGRMHRIDVERTFAIVLKGFCEWIVTNL